MTVAAPEVPTARIVRESPRFTCTLLRKNPGGASAMAGMFFKKQSLPIRAADGVGEGGGGKEKAFGLERRSPTLFP